MRALGLVFTFSVLCGCVTALPAMASYYDGSAAGRYEARGHNWTLVVTQDSIFLRDQVGEGHLEYAGSVLEPRVLETGIRYEGELVREHVVAGLVEQDLLPYVLTITERPCVDEGGRVSPTSVDWAFGLAAHQAAGCGGEIPRAGSKL